MNICVFYKYVGLQLFTVGGANPQRLPDGGHAGKDEVVVVGIGDEGGVHNLAVGEKSAAKITHLYENGWHNWGIGRDVVHRVSTVYHTSFNLAFSSFSIMLIHFSMSEIRSFMTSILTCFVYL